jgi:tetratricopeptide (TPR) repeat protein
MTIEAAALPVLLLLSFAPVLAAAAPVLLAAAPVLAATPAPPAGTTAAAGTVLAPVPPIDVSGMEPAVREQVEAARRAVAAAASQPAGEAAASFGEAGKTFLLYALLEAALPCFENAAALAPTDFRWAYFAGIALQRRGDLDRARDRLLRAIELRQPFPAALCHLGEVELLRGDLDAATRAFTAALAFPGTAAEAHFGLGRAALRRGDARLAAEHLEAALAAQPGAAVVHAPLATAYRRLGELEKARAQAAAYGNGPVAFPDPLLQEVMAANAGNMRRIQAATEALKAGRFAEAAAGICQAIAADPADVRSWMILGRAQERLGDAAAEQSYRRAVELDPDNARARFSLGTLLAARGARAAGIEQLEAAVRLRPDLPDARFNLAAALADEGRLAEALAQCETLLATAPQDSGARALRDQLRGRLGGQPPPRPPRPPG